MVSILEPFIRWKSSDKFRLFFSSCEPTILQDLRCDARRSDGKQIHRHNTRADKKPGGEKQYSGPERRHSQLSNAEDIRIIRWAKDRYHVVSERRVSSKNGSIYVFCRYDNGTAKDECHSCPIPAADRIVGFG